MGTYTFGATVHEPIDSVRPRLEAALKAEGFGILTEIDVAATLKAKLDVDHSPYVILGACNPSLANRALSADSSIGALLPCNIVLRTGDDADETVIEVLDPLTMTELAGTQLEAIATEAADRLHRALAATVPTR